MGYPEMFVETFAKIILFVEGESYNMAITRNLYLDLPFTAINTAKLELGT
jgi:hypothetical protein